MPRERAGEASSRAALVTLVFPALAQAETLITSVSTPRVAIQSNFTGRRHRRLRRHRPGGRPEAPGRYDIVVTVRGPTEPMDVRRKDRVLGIWINCGAAGLPRGTELPRHSLDAAGRGDRRGRGREPLRPVARCGAASRTRTSSGDDDLPFRAALVRLKSEAGLYLERPTGVTFLSDDRCSARQFRCPPTCRSASTRSRRG